MKLSHVLGSCWMVLSLSPLLGATGSGHAPPETNPRLIVFITVDQLRGDYLTRFESLFEAGLKHLLNRGFRFQDAHQAHAITSTGPGHASLATGVVPARSGIIGNSWYDRMKGDTVNCVEDLTVTLLGSSDDGRSPRNLLVPTLADWIKTGSPASQVYSISRKDRGAILTAGHRADGAFWYNGHDGRFITSTFYESATPDWLERFNQQAFPEAFFGRRWEALPVSAAALLQTDTIGTERGDYPNDFPHALGAASLVADESFFAAFGATPFMDQYVVELAKALIEAKGLGRDDALDFLGLSFSALDSVGHSYGPNSREALDTLLRLDRTLGAFFEFLDQAVGMSRVLITLSADHGVMPLPELLRRRGFDAKRVDAAEIGCIQQTMALWSATVGKDDWLLNGLYLNYATLGRRNLLRSNAESQLGKLLERCEAVERVWTRSELESPEGNGSAGKFFQLYRDSFHPDRSADLLVQPRKYRLGSTGYGTSHGSPYEYDTHVPLILLIPGVQGRPVADPVRTVDLAPTLAGLLAISAPIDLDGVDLQEFLVDSSANLKK